MNTTTLTPLTTAGRAVLEAAHTLARAQTEVEAAMDAWMTAGEIGDGAEWDRLATARRARNDAADHLYDVASRETIDNPATDVPPFLRPYLSATNGAAR